MAVAAQHDPAIKEAITNAASYVGIAAANVVAMIHPDMVILGGGVAQIGDLLLQTVREEIKQRVGMFPTDNVQVLASKLAGQAGVMGAVALARES